MLAALINDLMFRLIYLTFWTILISLPSYSQAPFWDDSDQFLEAVVHNGRVDYNTVGLYKDDIKALIETIGTYTTGSNEQEDKAFYINAYNLITISKISEAYPITSVQKIPDFFTSSQPVAGQEISLDDIENLLFEKDPDFRIHFAIVCGAKDCAPIQPFAYRGSVLNNQLDMITRSVINNPSFIKKVRDQNQYKLSKLFQWNEDHLSESVSSFINKYRLQKIDPDAELKYLPYNWSLNDSGNTRTIDIQGDSRYFVSRLYDKGEYELRVFNNYYTQLDKASSFSTFDERSSFNSLFATILVGINPNLNIGVEVKLRSVHQNLRSSDSKFGALSFKNENYTTDEFGRVSYRRMGLTSIAPVIKYKPIKSLPNFSIQHTLSIPIGKNLEGNDLTGYIDWGSPVLNNQLFYDHNLHEKFSIFAEVGLFIENINAALIKKSQGYYQYATPITMIFNYYPWANSTFFALMSAAPKWNVSVDGNQNVTRVPDAYNQYGIGYKHFITPKFQFEVLYTKFLSAIHNREASTYNVAFRYFNW